MIIHWVLAKHKWNLGIFKALPILFSLTCIYICLYETHIVYWKSKTIKYAYTCIYKYMCAHVYTCVHSCIWICNFYVCKLKQKSIWILKNQKVFFKYIRILISDWRRGQEMKRKMNKQWRNEKKSFQEVMIMCPVLRCMIN